MVFCWTAEYLSQFIRKENKTAVAQTAPTYTNIKNQEENQVPQKMHAQHLSEDVLCWQS